METSMLRRLRLKFIALNMATVSVVLAIAFTVVCYANYQQNTNSVYSALDDSIMQASVDIGVDIGSVTGGNTLPRANDAADTSGTPPSGETDGASETSPSDEAADASDAPSSDEDADTLDAPPSDETTDASGTPPSATNPPEIGGKREDGNGENLVIPVVVCTLENDGSATIVSSLTTASIADDTLEDATLAVADEKEGQGYLDSLGLFYVKRTVGNDTYLALADSSAASSWQSLALTLAAIGFGTLAVFLVISVFFSRWSLRPVAQAWDQQQRFVADASHELKTPLTVILANTAILREHPECSIASQSQWVESTQTEAERMQELVCDMLELARADHAEADLQKVPVDLTDLMEGALLQFESVAFERHVEPSADVDRDVNVMGDATRLHRLVTTLLDNACKYAGERGSIAVTLRREAHHAKLTVRNTGTAIAQEDLPHVFDRFYRADKARTRSEGSYGLGLSIAREIAEEHGGTIEASSDGINGTAFVVTIPLADV